MTEFPLWAVGLVLAALSPLIVRLLADALEARAQKRSQALINHQDKN
jgi:hypothetical protein